MDIQTCSRQCAHGTKIVADEEYGPSFPGGFSHLPKTFSLKGCVSDGQDFIYQQNVRFEMSGHGKGETDIHSARVILNRCVDKLINFCERYNCIELLHNLLSSHSKNCAVQKNVFASRQFRVKTRADFQKAGQATANSRASQCWHSNPGKDLEQCTLAGAVTSDDTDCISLFNLK